MAMAHQTDPQRLQGRVALSEAIDSLRDELARSMWNGRTPYFDEDGSEYLLQFKPSEIEVTLNIDFSVTGEAEAGIKWWLVNASAKGSATNSATQTIKLSLNPVRVDARTGEATEILIDGPVTDDDATEYH